MFFWSRLILDAIGVAAIIVPIYGLVLLTRVLGRLDRISARLDDIAERLGPRT